MGILSKIFGNSKKEILGNWYKHLEKLSPSEYKTALNEFCRGLLLFKMIPDESDYEGIKGFFEKEKNYEFVCHSLAMYVHNEDKDDHLYNIIEFYSDSLFNTTFNDKEKEHLAKYKSSPSGKPLSLHHNELKNLYLKSLLGLAGAVKNGDKQDQVDIVMLYRSLSENGEISDFFTNNPDYNTATSLDELKQHFKKNGWYYSASELEKCVSLSLESIKASEKV